MADVEVYRYVRGMPIEKAMGYHRQVKWQVRLEAYRGGAKARAALNSMSEKRTGASQIKVNEGASGTDWYVTLSDEASQDAANIIEFGRSPDRPPGSQNGPSRGVHPLEIAFGKYWTWR